MAKVVLNITPHLVGSRIDRILPRHHNNLYQRAFSLPDIYQELLTYVVNLVPIIFVIVEEEQELPVECDALHQLVEEKVRLDAIIYQGMRDLLPQDYEEQQRILCEKVNI